MSITEADYWRCILTLARGVALGFRGGALAPWTLSGLRARAWSEASGGTAHGIAAVRAWLASDSAQALPRRRALRTECAHLVARAEGALRARADVEGVDAGVESAAGLRRAGESGAYAACEMSSASY